MSPITREARDRLMLLLRSQQKDNDVPPREISRVERLVNDLIAAVRAEQPGDNRF